MEEDVYKWDADESKTRISIVDATPHTTALFPAIVVNTVSGREERYLGPDFLEENEDGQEVRFVGITATVAIRTYVRETADRDELIDLIFEKIKVRGDKLAELGIAIHRITIPSDTREFVQDRWWYIGSFSIDLYTEWSFTEKEEYITLENFIIPESDQMVAEH